MIPAPNKPLKIAAAVLAAALAALLACPVGAQPPLPEPWARTEAIELLGGRWFDGVRFRERRSTFIVDGRLTLRRPSRVDRRVDLAGGYVVPPIGDAHTHVFDGRFGLQAQRAQYLRDGVFYAMAATTPSRSASAIRDSFSGPTNVDVVNAFGGITGPRSHPAEIYEAVALGFYSYEQQLANTTAIRASRQMADDAYFVVETPADVEAKWALLRAFRPGIVKVYLRTSRRYSEGWGEWGPGGGIDPRLLPQIVGLAGREGLRVAAAVSDLSDFQAAVSAGVDLITHLPCYQDSSAPGPYQDFDTAEWCLIPPAWARRAARAGVISVLITTEWEEDDRSAEHRAWERANIAVLQRAGAGLAVGSDAYGSTPVAGLIAAAGAGVLPRATLLRLATVDTPRAIFPGRRVGCLSEGCEASFLVLRRDPLADTAALREIGMRVKDGLLLREEDYRAPPRAR